MKQCVMQVKVQKIQSRSLWCFFFLRSNMQRKVWRHTGGMLLPSNLCVFAELLCRLQPVLFPSDASLQLHAGWKSSQDPQLGSSSWWAPTVQVCVYDHT